MIQITESAQLALNTISTLMTAVTYLEHEGETYNNGDIHLVLVHLIDEAIDGIVKT